MIEYHNFINYYLKASTPNVSSITFFAEIKLNMQRE